MSDENELNIHSNVLTFTGEKKHSVRFDNPLGWKDSLVCANMYLNKDTWNRMGRPKSIYVSAAPEEAPQT
jgi:hypothetical protein